VNVAILAGDAASDYSGAIATRLAEQGDTVSAIVIARVQRLRRARLLLARKGFAGVRDALLTRIGRRGSGASTGAPTLGPTLAAAARERSVGPVVVTDVNGPEALAVLRAARPDLIIYTGGGILKSDLLSIPSIGVLNAHMGLLPAYRGMNALEWALLNGDDLGVTVHFIDRGVDTGDILLQRRLPVGRADTIAALRAIATRESVDALAEVVSRLRAGAVEPLAQPSAGKQYFVMHARLKQIAERRLRPAGGRGGTG
jgi:methionyl-tRNA formyltransferase